MVAEFEIAAELGASTWCGYLGLNKKLDLQYSNIISAKDILSVQFTFNILCWVTFHAFLNKDACRGEK